MTPTELLNLADSFTIDPHDGVKVVSESGQWKVFQYENVLRDDGVWEYLHNIPYGKKDKYLIPSVQEAIDRYVQWRNKNYYIYFFNVDEWKVYTYRPLKDKLLDEYWDACLIPACRIMVSPDRKVIKTHGELTSDIHEFKDLV